MRYFLELNRHKLGFMFLASSIIFLLLVSILLIVIYFNAQFPGARLLSAILLMAGIGFPVFIIVLAYIEWLLKRRVRQRAFSVSPFDELGKIGFYPSFINLETKWYFTEETMEGVVNGFRLTCNVTREKPKQIEFIAQTKSNEIDKKEFKTLKGKLKKDGIIFSWGGLSKSYDIRRSTFQTIKQLEADLVAFTENIKRKGFEPKFK